MDEQGPLYVGQVEEEEGKALRAAGVASGGGTLHPAAPSVTSPPSCSRPCSCQCVGGHFTTDAYRLQRKVGRGTKSQAAASSPAWNLYLMHGHQNCLFRVLNTRDYRGGGGRQRFCKVCGPKEMLEHLGDVSGNTQPSLLLSASSPLALFGVCIV